MYYRLMGGNNMNQKVKSTENRNHPRDPTCTTPMSFKKLLGLLSFQSIYFCYFTMRFAFQM